MKVLSEDIIRQKLESLPGWNFIENHLEKEFQLKNFMSVISFINRLANFAEKIDHHPDFYVHGWNKIKFKITTHSEGGVTELDFSLASKIESLAQV